MFKRLRWIGTGAALGVCGSVWAQLKLKRTAQRYAPPEIGSRVAVRARDLGHDVAGAVAEGRQAMHEREAELRARLDPSRARPSSDVRDVASRPVSHPIGRPGLERRSRR